MRRNLLVLMLLLAAFSVTVSGCAGLFMWEKGHYYHSEVMDSASLAAKDVRTVGVYVFSDGEAVEHTMVMGLGLTDWPSQVERSSSFDPDTSLAGPSLELANDIAKELNDKGYTAKAVTDMGHSGDITAEQCLAHAQKNGYDSALIVEYRGIRNWRQAMGTVVLGSAAAVLNHNGFLYIPNATFFEAKTGDQLWTNYYYGLVEYAHLPNFWNESFVKVAEKAFVDNDAETYILAAPKAASLLLEPPLFPGTTKAFPTKGEKKHRM